MASLLHPLSSFSPSTRNRSCNRQCSRSKPSLRLICNSKARKWKLVSQVWGESLSLSSSRHLSSRNNLSQRLKSIYSKHDEDGSTSKSSNLLQEEKPHESDDANGTGEESPQKLNVQETGGQHAGDSHNDESAVVGSQEQKQEMD